MRKYKLTISAYICENIMTIFSQEYFYNIMTSPDSFISILRNIMPTVDWVVDDGSEEEGTEHLQYVNYPDNTENYLLASWVKTRDYKENEII